MRYLWRPVTSGGNDAQLQLNHTSGHFHTLSWTCRSTCTGLTSTRKDLTIFVMISRGTNRKQRIGQLNELIKTKIQTSIIHPHVFANSDQRLWYSNNDEITIKAKLRKSVKFVHYFTSVTTLFFILLERRLGDTSDFYYCFGCVLAKSKRFRSANLFHGKKCSVTSLAS